MELFNIWNPARIADDEIRFDVTRANMPHVGSGDPEWVAACLRAVGVTASAREWSIQPTRASFYSSYPQHPDWLDRWPHTWVVNVKIDGNAPRDFPPPHAERAVVDVRDSTWEYSHESPDHNDVALLLVLLTGTPDKTGPLRTRVLELLPQIETIATSVEAAGSDHTWLRIMARAAHLFPNQVTQVEDFIDKCKVLNLVVNYVQLYHK